MFKLNREVLKQKLYKEIEHLEETAKTLWRYAKYDEEGLASRFEQDALKLEKKSDLFRSYIDRIDKGEPISNCENCVFYNPNYVDQDKHTGIEFHCNYCEQKNLACYDTEFVLFCESRKER